MGVGSRRTRTSAQLQCVFGGWGGRVVRSRLTFGRSRLFVCVKGGKNDIIALLAEIIPARFPASEF